MIQSLNYLQKSSLSDIVEHTKLPRGTAYRILLTLEELEYIRKDSNSGLYELKNKLLGLSCGYDLENWTTEVARALIEELCADVIWPISITTLSGASAIVRENTDPQSAMVFQNTKGGYEMPIFASASGWILFAFSADDERRAILTAVKRASQKEGGKAVPSQDQIAARVKEIRTQRHFSYATAKIRTTAIAVPILRPDGAVLAALALRYFTKAVRREAAIERFAPKLHDAAAKISNRYQVWLDSNETTTLQTGSER